MGLAIGIGNGILFTSQTSIRGVIPELLSALEARSTYFENSTCTTSILTDLEDCE